MPFFKNLNLLNLLMILIILLFLFLKIIPSCKYEPRFEIVPAGIEVDKIEEIEMKGNMLDQELSAYAVIPEKNLFHPERRIIEVAEDKTVISDEEVDIVLYGTLIADNVRIAYMENKERSVKQSSSGKQRRTFHIGDTLAGYTLQEIYKDSVVLLRGEDKIVVKVYDPANPKKRRLSRKATSRGNLKSKDKKTVSRKNGRPSSRSVREKIQRRRSRRGDQLTP